MEDRKMLNKIDYNTVIEKIKRSIKEGKYYVLTAQDKNWVSEVSNTDPAELTGMACGFLVNDKTDFEGLYETYDNHFKHTTLYLKSITLLESKALKRVLVSDLGVLRLDDYYDVTRELFGLGVPEDVIADPLTESDLIHCTFHVSYLTAFEEAQV